MTWVCRPLTTGGCVHAASLAPGAARRRCTVRRRRRSRCGQHGLRPQERPDRPCPGRRPRRARRRGCGGRGRGPRAAAAARRRDPDPGPAPRRCRRARAAAAARAHRARHGLRLRPAARGAPPRARRRSLGTPRRCRRLARPRRPRRPHQGGDGARRRVDQRDGPGRHTGWATARPDGPGSGPSGRAHEPGALPARGAASRGAPRWVRPPARQPQPSVGRRRPRPRRRAAPRTRRPGAPAPLVARRVAAPGHFRSHRRGPALAHHAAVRADVANPAAGPVDWRPSRRSPIPPRGARQVCR